MNEMHKCETEECETMTEHTLCDDCVESLIGQYEDRLLEESERRG